MVVPGCPGVGGDLPLQRGFPAAGLRGSPTPCGSFRRPRAGSARDDIVVYTVNYLGRHESTGWPQVCERLFRRRRLRPAPRRDPRSPANRTRQPQPRAEAALPSRRSIEIAVDVLPAGATAPAGTYPSPSGGDLDPRRARPARFAARRNRVSRGIRRLMTDNAIDIDELRYGRATVHLQGGALSESLMIGGKPQSSCGELRA
jgi:hypothetical protein